MNRKIKLLIPHTSQRGNFYQRGEYRENQLPPEILKSKNIIIEFEEETLVDPIKENIVIIKKETRIEAENKGLVENPKIEERVETLGLQKIEERTPVIEKVNHNAKKAKPPAIKNEYEPILDKDLDKEVTIKDKITRLI